MNRLPRKGQTSWQNPSNGGGYQLIDSEEERHGKCIECGDRISVEIRWYREIATGKEKRVRVRTACSCPGYEREQDLYAGR